MRLHVAYRLHGGEGSLECPSSHHQRASLSSALDAAEYAGAHMIVLANGPIPADLRTLVARRARVVSLPNGPLATRGSFLTSLRYPDVAGWPDEDVVYFCDDDYVHRVDALAELGLAAKHVTSAHYFAPCASTPRHSAAGSGAEVDAPAHWRPEPDYAAGDTVWVNVPSATNTFGARIGSLRQDLGIFRQASVPYPTRYLDREMFLVAQGCFPYSASEILSGHSSTHSPTGPNALAANAALAPFRLAYQLRALTRRRTPHLLYAADPHLAYRLETDRLPAGVDRSAVIGKTDTY